LWLWGVLEELINNIRETPKDYFLCQYPEQKAILKLSQIGLTIRASWRALIYLGKAWRLRRRKNPAAIKLPPVGRPCRLSHKQIIFLESWLTELVRLVIPSKRHRCYDRGFTLAAVFRELGIPVTLNVGLRKIFNAGRVTGHCWLSLNGQIFKEKSNPQVIYPYALGTDAEGVNYFVGEY
jgi:hypothetical protein